MLFDSIPDLLSHATEPLSCKLHAPIVSSVTYINHYTQWRKPAQQFGGGGRSGSSPSNESKFLKLLLPPLHAKTY